MVHWKRSRAGVSLIQGGVGAAEDEQVYRQSAGIAKEIRGITAHIMWC